jgi:hypothetical protein
VRNALLQKVQLSVGSYWWITCVKYSMSRLKAAIIKQLGNNAAAFSIDDLSFVICHCANYFHRNQPMKNENSSMENENA